MARTVRNLLGVAVLLALVGCSYPVRNEMTPGPVFGDDHGYQLGKLAPDDLPGTLVIVTASGGGTRATALALSVLEGLDEVMLPNGRSLAQEVDVISSVSGGSVAAAYFALKGPAGFDALENDFIRRDGMAALMTAGLNPFGLARLATNGTERIDLLIDYLNRRLFHDATFATLLQDRRRPLLVLNAADMVEGTPFSFTQRTFDLLCSDLTRMPLATAVAASAAFPVALSPVTLKDYQPCPAVQEGIKRGVPWPPAWVKAGLDPAEDIFVKPSRWYNNPIGTSLARVENAYALGDSPASDDRKLYIHLLDGGIADNLGITAPYRMLTTRTAMPNFFQAIAQGKITRLIFIVINARSAASSSLDQSEATPGALDMLLASIDSPLDRATAGIASRLRQSLLDEFRQVKLADPAQQERFHELSRNTALVSVDFDAIGDAGCRQRYHDIPTSWTLAKKQIDAVLIAGKALLGNDPEFDHVLQLTGANRPSLPSLKQACEALPPRAAD